MQVVVFILLAALVGCHGDESQCSEDRCHDDFLEKLPDAKSRDKSCKLTTDSLECLEKTLETCAEGAEKENLKETIDEFKSVQNLYCKELTENVDIEACIEVERIYAQECTRRRRDIAKFLGVLTDEEGAVNYNVLHCRLFKHAGECVLERIESMCGSKAAVVVAKKALDEIPAEVVETCDAAGVKFPFGPLVEEEKKK